jgi:2-methylisocitrate lyase-like PEP mutase family enzyme
MSSHESMSLRDRLSQPEILVALGASDPLSAIIAQQAGIEALYQGGYAVSAHWRGLPDIGITGLADMAVSLSRITEVSSLPVIVDADTGFGAEPGVRHTVRTLEAAGAAAVQLEDQVFPKRCGHMAGKQVIPRDEMVLKIQAAVAERRNPETLIVARTDTLQVHGIDDAIDRCNAYAEAGADMTFVDAPPTREDVARIAREVGGLKLHNMSETGRTEVMTAAEIQDAGYDVVIFPSTQTWLFARVYKDLCETVLATGSTEGMRDRFMSFDEVNATLDLSGWQRPAGS